MKLLSSIRNIWKRAPKKAAGRASAPEIDPKYFDNIPTSKERVAKIIGELVFGENAQEDFHCSQALHNGVDDTGRVFVDFDEKRRDHVIRCMIWMACKNVEGRKAKQIGKGG
jgi:hypothetical protein